MQTATVSKIKEVSVYDTMHDFRSLGDNDYYTSYIHEELSKLDKSASTKKVAASHVEDTLTQKFGFSMTPSNFVDYTAKIASKAIPLDKQKKYFTRVKDMDNEIFKTWMGTIILMNTKQIDFVTDTTLMSYETGCSIRINTHNNYKKGRFITNSSTIYDRGNYVAAADNKPDCVLMLKNDEVQITKAQGHLFEIDYIKVNNNIVKYKIPEYTKEIQIDLSEYIKRESETQFKLPLYKAVITYMRRKTNVLNNLLVLLQKRYNIPSAFMQRVRNRDERARISLARMLFDFKRAGDHLQVKSCAGKGRVFISNDRMSILLSSLAGIPTIRTTKDTDHTRVVYFYNLSLTNDKEFQKLLNKNIKSAIADCIVHLNKFNQSIATIHSVFLPYYQWITTLTERLFNLVSSSVSRLNERSQTGRRTEMKYVFEYDCYYKWVVAYYFFSFLKFIVELGGSRNFDKVVQLINNSFNPSIDESNPKTKQILSGILDVINKNKFYDVINLDAMTSPGEMIQDVHHLFQNVDDVASITDSITHLLKKPYIHVIIGHNDVQTLFDTVWGKTQAKYVTDVKVDYQGYTISQLKAKLVCVTPKVASYISTAQSVFKKDITNEIVNNNIPWKLVSEIEHVEVDTDFVVQSSDGKTVTKRARRRQDGGTTHLQSSAARERLHTTSVRPTGNHVEANSRVSHFKATTNHAPQLVQNVTSVYQNPVPTTHSITVKRTAFQEAYNTDDQLTQVIVMFFLQTVPSLTEMIVNSEVGEIL